MSNHDSVIGIRDGNLYQNIKLRFAVKIIMWSYTKSVLSGPLRTIRLPKIVHALNKKNLLHNECYTWYFLYGYVFGVYF